MSLRHSSPARTVTPTRHPTGTRVIRREATRELGPANTETELLHTLTREIVAEHISDVESIVIDWRDDGCYLRAHSNTYVLLCGVGARR